MKWTYPIHDHDTPHLQFLRRSGRASLEVLEEAQRDLVSLPGVGMSILEISHRSKPFDDIIEGCEADMRTLAGDSPNYQVLFLQGGASLQFSMVPMNLLPPGGSADYIVTGVVVAEGRQGGQARRRREDRRVDRGRELHRACRSRRADARSHAAYVHYTTNNTIFGTEWHYVPDVGDVPLVADTSSDMFSRPIDVAKYGLIYAGAQKNLAPAGVTLVIIRDDLLEAHAGVARDDAAATACTREQVDVQHAAGVRHLRHAAGAEVAAEGRRPRRDRQPNQRKAEKLYAEIDRTGFYRGHAQQGLPLADERHVPPAERGAREEVRQGSDAAGLDGLKGHRSVGGMRASIYNAFPEAGVDALVEFMKEFEREERVSGARDEPRRAWAAAAKVTSRAASGLTASHYRSLTNRSRRFLLL